MASEKSRGADRTRTWTCVLYPESAPENWRDILDDLHIEWVESPLHDKDISADGSPKKAHKHILFLFTGPKSYEQVKSITDSIKQPIPERCHNAKALIRYMAHLDDPNKAQYPVDQIVGHGGVDVQDFLRPSASQRYDLIREMIRFCDSSGIVELADLLSYAAENRYEDWFPLLCDSAAYVMSCHLKSRRHSS